MNLYVPPDFLKANACYGASCGQAALAALLRLPVLEVRHLFPGFKGYTNPSTMLRAVRTAGRFRSLFHADGERILPEHGLAFLQVEGSWLNPGVPVAAAYKRSHWIAVVMDCDGCHWAYDCNNGTAGGWQTLSTWSHGTMQEIVQSHKGATGWHVRSGIEVKR